MSHPNPIRRCAEIAALAIALAACSNPASQRAADAGDGAAAANATQKTAQASAAGAARAAGATSQSAADARFAELGMGAAAASTYVQGQLCGIAEPALQAYLQREKTRYVKPPFSYSQAQFETDFNEAIALIKPRLVEAKRLTSADQHATACTWTTDLIKG